MQQVLAMQGHMEKFMGVADAAALRACFTGLYPLDESEEGLKAKDRAIQDPTAYVMKPQREGGGWLTQ